MTFLQIKTPVLFLSSQMYLSQLAVISTSDLLTSTNHIATAIGSISVPSSSSCSTAPSAPPLATAIQCFASPSYLIILPDVADHLSVPSLSLTTKAFTSKAIVLPLLRILSACLPPLSPHRMFRQLLKDVLGMRVP